MLPLLLDNTHLHDFKAASQNHMHLEHGLQVVGNCEGSLCLALDLLNGNSVGNLNKVQTVSEIDVENSLRKN